jgi:predicted nucleotidyltransferase
MLDDKTLAFLKTTIFKHLNPRDFKAFIFGSRAIGNNRKWSDIDIGIMGPQKMSPDTYFELTDALRSRFTLQD